MANADSPLDGGQFLFLPQERVIFGVGQVGTLGDELDRLGCQRALLVTSRSVAQSPIIERVRAIVGARLAGVYAEVTQHTPSGQVIAAATRAREAGADALISLGGGSVIDGTKAIAHALHASVVNRDELLRHKAPSGAPGPLLPHLAVSTTLSAAEFSHLVGITDEDVPIKTGIGADHLVPRIAILDPEVTVHTPPDLWSSTGIRALDHAVESLLSPDRQPLTDVLAQEAIRRLFANLPVAKAAPSDLHAKLECQLGAWMSFFGARSVRMGLSHQLGRRMGARFGIPHGVTSCLVLPHVVRLAGQAEPDRIARVAEAVGTARVGTPEDQARAAGDAIADLVARLGLPQRIRDAGISRDDLRWVADGDARALEVLEHAW